MLLLLVSFFIGYCIVRQFLRVENVIMLLAGSFLTGSLLSGVLLYLLDLVFIYSINNYSLGNIAFLALAVLYIGWYCYKRKPLTEIKAYLGDLWRDRLAIGVLAVFLLYSVWFNYYTFGVQNGNIQIRGGAWSDIMYHHAFIRSISSGTNIPTTYPYFANTVIHYHFMFDYYGGKLAQFGLNTIHALNVLSFLSFTFLLLLLFELGRRYFGSNAVGVITPVLLVLHSSAAAFDWIYKNSLESIFKKDGWLKGVNYEGWGLFNFNVFVNQRHFAFALALCVFVVLYMVLNREEVLLRKNQTFDKLVVLKSISFGILIGLIPFWNAIVAAICIAFTGLYGIMEFKRNKALMYGFLSSAIIAGLLVLPQLLMFKSGDTVLSGYPVLHPGYEIENPGLLSFLSYYYKVLGIKFILITASFIFVSRRKKLEFLVFIIPFIMANIWQFGKIQYDNNKLMIIWLLFANCYAAYIIVGIYNLPARFKNIRNKITEMWGLALRAVAAVLLVAVTLAGTIDLFALKNMNAITIKDKDSLLEGWIVKNTKPGSIFLTANFIPYEDNAISAVTLSGRMLYCVKNDVDSSVNIDKRMDNIKKIYTFEDGLEKTIQLIKEEKIDYILVDSVLRNSRDFKVNEEMFLQKFKLVYRSAKEYDGQDVLVFSLN